MGKKKGQMKKKWQNPHKILRSVHEAEEALKQQLKMYQQSQEAVPELNDDTTHATPMAIGAWTAVGGSKPNVGTTGNLQNNWLKFQQNLKKKGNGNQFRNTFVEAKDGPVSTARTTEVTPSSSGTGKEITWELNPIDEKEEEKDMNQSNSGPAPVKPEVVQGKASEIKLFLQNKDKTFTVQKQATEIISPEKNVNPGQSNTSLSDPFRPTNTPGNWNIGTPAQPALTLSQSYPKGVPRSFLTKQANVHSIQPQEQDTALKGVPRSFLTKQANVHSIQPQEQDTALKGVPRSFLTKHANVHSIQPQEQDIALKANKPQTGWPNKHKPLYLHEEPVFVQTKTDARVENTGEKQQYSPSDNYEDGKGVQMEVEGSDSPDEESGQKRLSAFQRLGPLSQPKKPKLTINLLCNKNVSVREVVNQTTSVEEDDKFTPVHLRKHMRDSKDEVVVKYLPHWPWKRTVSLRKSVTARSSKSVMILEQEQMEEAYDKENAFIQVSVRGYPPSWRKEQILDVLLENLRGKTFIPCFIEFKPDECKFLVIKARSALLALHKLGFYLRKDDVELGVTISQTELSLKQIDFIPRLVLRKILAAGYDGERKLSLKEFSIGKEISHFIYFPLNRLVNQSELVQLQSTIAWDFITDLDLSHNRLTSIDGFELPITTPRLKHLDLSHNCLQRVTALLRNRELSLRSLKLEGNPLCHDYIDPGHYVRVVKMIFPALVELDAVPIHLKGDFPPFKKNYCPNSEAMDVANKFLDVFFPLLEMPAEERARIEDLYDENAVMTVTYRSSLRYSTLHRSFRNIFLRARVLADGGADSVTGAAHIARQVAKWPELLHDPYTFTVDVLLHTENHTILKVGGVLKLTSDTLADDEHLVAFTRTVVLATDDGVEYKITNEMVYWDEPSKELSNVAFRLNSIPMRASAVKLDVNNPDEELRGQLVEIFMHITNSEKIVSERCLDIKEWNLKNALEYFMKLVKLNDLDSLQ